MQPGPPSGAGIDDGGPSGSPSARGPTGPRVPLRRAIIIAVDVVLFAILAVLLWHRAVPQARAALGLGSGDWPAPGFTLATLDGDSLSLESLRGRVVLVNFWASWCLPCRIEMPGFERVYRDYAADGFVIVGIATDTHARGSIREFLAEHDITYPIVLATPRVIGEYGGVTAIPESFLIDGSGRVRHRVIGYFAEPALRAAIKRMLESTG